MGNNLQIASVMGANPFLVLHHSLGISRTAALDSIAAGQSPSPSKIGGVVLALLRTWRHIGPSLDKGGNGAWADFWRIAPPVTAMAFALKLLGVRPPKD